LKNTEVDDLEVEEEERRRRERRREREREEKKRRGKGGELRLGEGEGATSTQPRLAGVLSWCQPSYVVPPSSRHSYAIDWYPYFWV
jgi:hypothetical protein